jgi:hypothetical protein
VDSTVIYFFLVFSCVLLLLFSCLRVVLASHLLIAKYLKCVLISNQSIVYRLLFLPVFT